MQTAWFIVHRAREVLISLLMYSFFTAYYPPDCEIDFECDNGDCVLNMNKCDGYNDCGDNSDEHKCGGM